MYSTMFFFSALLFSFSASVSGVAIAATDMPRPTLPSGVINPFFPCGLNEASVLSCPNRCYSIVTTASYTNAALVDACFSDTEAAALIGALTHICVKCVVPLRSELPNSLSKQPTCRPVTRYFEPADYVNERFEYYPTKPSRCGTAAQPNTQCPWECAQWKREFTVCDVRDTSESFRICTKCLPQCSSPVVTFNPPTIPSNFSLNAGSCSNQYGAQQSVACPFRCTDFEEKAIGPPYCSLANLTSPSEGTWKCQKCT